MEKIRADLAAFPEIRLLPRTTVAGYYDHNYLTLAERKFYHLGRGADGVRQRLWKVRAKRVVLATGAHEWPLVFADNDRPGIMLAGATRTYANRYGVLPRRCGVVFTNNDSAYDVAIDLAKAGCRIEAILDVRVQAMGPAAERAFAVGLRVICGAAIVGVNGTKRVKGVEIVRLAADGETASGPVERLSCDFVAASGGWTPAVHLMSQSGGKLLYDDEKACFVPDRSVQAESSAGAWNGAFSLLGALSEGAAAGRAAAEAAGLTPAKRAAFPKVEAEEPQPIHPLWIVPGKKPVGFGKAKNFVNV
ncbi:hypothetical protein [Breoghania sp.]|uniref:hypothetical protein n=1 Tax=Breoghania sp. TaxID=2065378 RepID=UPI002606B5A4|nr:hypothetical protein [Breoghania sp.]MDJ0932993.1 hypothetical protein [Breoghania sp.]